MMSVQDTLDHRCLEQEGHRRGGSGFPGHKHGGGEGALLRVCQSHEGDARRGAGRGGGGGREEQSAQINVSGEKEEDRVLKMAKRLYKVLGLHPTCLMRSLVTLVISNTLQLY